MIPEPKNAGRSHRAPGMGCQPAHEPVVPEIAIATEAKKKNCGERAETFFVYGSPDGLQAGMVQRLVERQPGYAHRQALRLHFFISLTESSTRRPLAMISDPRRLGYLLVKSFRYRC